MGIKPGKDLVLARRRHGAGEFAAALKIYRRLLDDDPQQPELLVLAATAAAQLGQLQQAEELARRSLEQRADGPAQLTLGRILMQAGKAAEALQWLELARSDSRVAADAAFCQGQLERSTGSFESADQALAYAVAIAPGHAPAWNEYGILRMQRGEHEQALICFRNSLSSRPHDLATMTNLVSACIECGEWAQAEQTLDGVLAQDSANGPGLALLGRLRKQQGRLPEALAAWRGAVDVAPGHADWRAGLAMTQQAMGDYQEAGANYERALMLSPGSVDALVGRAEWLEWQGRYQAGLESLRALDPESRQQPGPALVSARLWRRLGDSPRARQILADAIPLSGSYRRAFCFSLGDVCDELGDYAQAWDWYQQGNQLTPATFHPDAQIEASRVIERMATQAPAGDGGTDLLFIVGMPRSGTSLLEQMLAAHPGVCAAGELPAFGELVHGAMSASDARRPALLARLAEDYRRSLPTPETGTRLLSDKMPLNFQYLPLIRRVFPAARIVHCRRDLRDIGLSCFFTDFADQALGFATRLDWLQHYLTHYNRQMLRWSADYSPVYQLDYEKLVTQPEQVLRGLLEYCGLDWDPACLDFDSQQRVVATASHAQVRQALHKQSVARWRNYQNWLGPLSALASEPDQTGPGRQ
ncbi:MAG: sulfotransferase [Gammaproteobacteria bacterium]